jgi:mono/diheme cytochrome c family protein
VPLALTGYEIGLLTSALAFMAFALVVALVVPRTRPDFPSKYLGWFIGVCVAFFLVQMGAVLALAEIGEEHESTAQESEPTGTETAPTETTPTETTETTEASGDPAAGKDVFASAGCVSCHTLADAGATGTIGPNLDASAPPPELVVERVTNGQGAMPSFSDSLSEQQIQDVAAYVSSVAG